MPYAGETGPATLVPPDSAPLPSAFAELPAAERSPSLQATLPVTTPRNPVYPDLAGQYADYLELQLELFGRGARGGTAYGHVMETVASRLTREQRRAAALYYASLPPGVDRRAPRRRRRHGGEDPAH